MAATGIALELQEKGHRLEEAMTFPEAKIPFWHTTILDKDGYAVSSGFGSDKNQARKIAVAEYIERGTHKLLAASGNETRASWGLNIIPTACGFAVGFDKFNTVLRSISEAAERWTMSKWIDEGFHLEALSKDRVTSELDEVSKFLLTQFEEVLFFRKKVRVEVAGLPLEIEVGQTMGLKGNGIFPGSSAQTTGNSLWQHALIESLRHLLCVRNNLTRPHRFPENKVRHFAENAHIALETISEAKRNDWPSPRLRFHRAEYLPERGAYLARTIFDGWKSWDEGPVERFLY